MMRQVQRHSPVAHRDGVRDATQRRNLLLEPLHIFADRGNPARVEAIIDIGLFQLADERLIDGNERPGGGRAWHGETWSLCVLLQHRGFRPHVHELVHCQPIL